MVAAAIAGAFTAGALIRRYPDAWAHGPANERGLQPTADDFDVSRVASNATDQGSDGHAHPLPYLPQGRPFLAIRRS